MSLLHAVLLGAVQGLTELLPISSTAHLVLVPWLLEIPDPGLSFDVALHVGTLLAVVAYFRNDVGRLLAGAARFALRRASSSDPDARLVLLVGVGTIPAVALGLALKPLIETTLRGPHVIACTLIGVALAILAIERRGEGTRGIEDLTVRDALVIGLCQAAALVPGVSRSGGTVAGALLLGLRRAEAVRFSFVLGLPAIFGACLLEGRKLLSGQASFDPLTLGLGVLVSAATGYACVAWLMAYIRTRTFAPFMIYRIALGLLVLALIFAGKAPAGHGG